MNLEELVLPMKIDSAGFNKALKGITAGIGVAAAAVGVMVKATFDWAQEMDSLQDVMGVTNKTAAALNFVLRKSGTSTETLSKGMVILEKGLVKANGQLDTTGKTLKTWGINVFDANHHLKDQTQLIEDVTKKYSSFATQQEKVNFLTEVFGRNGAEMVDFFDTLAAEGGIDAVTKKVEAFGLAIDPNRYEQFNRNLEELKLVGLGLAVSFTEKVMPALEGFLGWFTEFAKDPDPAKALIKIDAFVSGIVNGMATKVNTWLQGGGPEQLSEDIMSWVDKVGEGPGLDLKSGTAITRLVDALGKAITRIDWIGITDAIDTKLAESIDNVDWESIGDKFGSALTNTTVSGVNSKESEAVPALGNALNSLMLGAIGAASWDQYGAAFKSNLGRVIHKPFDAYAASEGGQAITEAIRRMFTTATNQAYPQVSNQSATLGRGFGSGITTAFSSTTPGFIGSLNTWEGTVDNKLRDISKTFFNAAVRWTAQMKAGFMDGIEGLLSIVHGLVDNINNILKGIITSFKINISSNAVQLGGGTIVHPTAPDKTKDDKRASGGPVIAGQSYTVGELRPETFTPTSNGRIGATSNEVTLSSESIRELANILADKLGAVIPSATIKAMNNV